MITQFDPTLYGQDADRHSLELTLHVLKQLKDKIPSIPWTPHYYSDNERIFSIQRTYISNAILAIEDVLKSKYIKFD